MRHGLDDPRHPATPFSTWFDAGAEIDLGRLIGLDHTRLHVQGADFEGDIPSAIVVGLRFDIRFAQFLMGSSPICYGNGKIY